MELSFKEWNCKTELGQYKNKRLAIQLVDAEDGSPVATATVNIPEFGALLEDEVIIKNHSENEGMTDALFKAGIVTGMIRTHIHSGFVECPVMKLTKKFIEEVNAEGYSIS